MKRYFIADTHFTEDNIRRYENRPYQNVVEMDNRMISCWNKIINEDDMIYILGDFGADEHELCILNQLKGVKYLVKGNHDVKSNEYYRNVGFQEVYDCPII